MLQFKTKTDRLMARTAIGLIALMSLFFVYSFGRPIYWRFYATVWRPFEDPGDMPPDTILKSFDPFKEAVKEKKQISAEHGDLHEQQQLKIAPQLPATVMQSFDVNSYALTKERVQGQLHDGYIMVTWANHHYLDFAKSWVYHIKKAGITGYLVGAMDDEMLKSLAEAGISTWRMDSGITKDDLGWGSPNFHKMGRAKISLIKQFLAFGVHVVMSDIDTAWLRNPMPYFQKYPEADILTSTDQLAETVKDESLELFPQAGASFNIGIMMFRPKSMTFVDEWIKKLEDPKMWDQSAFNDLARLGHTNSDPANKNLFKGYQGKLTMGVLPASIFASGHMFFVQRKYEELGLQPYVAHATFQYSGTPGKRNRFREFLLFDDPPEYFDHPKGFIHLKIDVPKELLDKAKGIQGTMTANLFNNHFNLVHYQLQRLRTGLALATITGRVLILPPIWCEIDKYWAPLLDGNIPGSHFRKPFICPMDHILDIEAYWHKKLPEQEFGPHIEWREYSFPQNPRLTSAVNGSGLVVKPCAGNVCPGGAKAMEAQDGQVSVSSSADIARLREVLNSPQAASYKILELPSPALEALHQVYKTFPEPELAMFTRRLQHYVSVVCCMQESPGWVWYDFFADVYPRTDRFGRSFPDETFLYYKGETKDLAQGSPTPRVLPQA